jgi:hypothetical protein
MRQIQDEFQKGSGELDHDTRLLFRPGLQKLLPSKIQQVTLLLTLWFRLDGIAATP